MHPESLQGVQHLLIGWCSKDSIADLETIILILKSGLPNTQLSLLTSSALTSGSVSEYLSSITIQDEVGFTTVIKTLRQAYLEAALIFTSPGNSPYSMAYLCYLAGIPIRVGQSNEFGGRVLSTCITPLPDASSAIEHHLYLLKSLDIPIYSHLFPSIYPQVQSKI